MTKQETFDLVVAHARTMDVRCEVEWSCAYRGPDGGKCFAGCLIPDAMYSVELEGKLAGHPDMRRLWAGLGHDVAFVEQLQGIHDNAPLEAWEYQFEDLARCMGLTYTP